MLHILNDKGQVLLQYPSISDQPLDARYSISSMTGRPWPEHTDVLDRELNGYHFDLNVQLMCSLGRYDVNNDIFTRMTVQRAHAFIHRANVTIDDIKREYPLSRRIGSADDAIVEARHQPLERGRLYQLISKMLNPRFGPMYDVNNFRWDNPHHRYINLSQANSFLQRHLQSDLVNTQTQLNDQLGRRPWNYIVELRQAFARQDGYWMALIEKILRSNIEAAKKGDLEMKKEELETMEETSQELWIRAAQLDPPAHRDWENSIFANLYHIFPAIRERIMTYESEINKARLVVLREKGPGFASRFREDMFYLLGILERNLEKFVAALFAMLNAVGIYIWHEGIKAKVIEFGAVFFGAASRGLMATMYNMLSILKSGVKMGLSYVAEGAVKLLLEHLGPADLTTVETTAALQNISLVGLGEAYLTTPAWTTAVENFIAFLPVAAVGFAAGNRVGRITVNSINQIVQGLYNGRATIVLAAGTTVWASFHIATALQFMYSTGFDGAPHWPQTYLAIAIGTGAVFGAARKVIELTSGRFTFTVKASVMRLLRRGRATRPQLAKLNAALWLKSRDGDKNWDTSHPLHLQFQFVSDMLDQETAQHAEELRETGAGFEQKMLLLDGSKRSIFAVIVKLDRSDEGLTRGLPQGWLGFDEERPLLWSQISEEFLPIQPTAMAGPLWSFFSHGVGGVARAAVSAVSAAAVATSEADMEIVAKVARAGKGLQLRSLSRARAERARLDQEAALSVTESHRRSQRRQTTIDGFFKRVFSRAVVAYLGAPDPQTQKIHRIASLVRLRLIVAADAVSFRVALCRQLRLPLREILNARDRLVDVPIHTVALAQAPTGAARIHVTAVARGRARDDRRQSLIERTRAVLAGSAYEDKRRFYPFLSPLSGGSFDDTLKLLRRVIHRGGANIESFAVDVDTFIHADLQNGTASFLIGSTESRVVGSAVPSVAPGVASIEDMHAGGHAWGQVIADKAVKKEEMEERAAAAALARLDKKKKKKKRLAPKQAAKDKREHDTRQRKKERDEAKEAKRRRKRERKMNRLRRTLHIHNDLHLNARIPRNLLLNSHLLLDEDLFESEHKLRRVKHMLMRLSPHLDLCDCVEADELFGTSLQTSRRETTESCIQLHSDLDAAEELMRCFVKLRF